MHAAIKDLPLLFEVDGASSRQVEWGGMTVAFERGVAGMDNAPLFKGLPDDRCQCPHWGYLLSGRMRVRYADREEVINAGELYYLAPGHTLICEEDGELIEFSPKDEYQKTMEVAFKNFQAMQQAQ